MAQVMVATTATRIDTVAETDTVAGSVAAIKNVGAATVYVGSSASVTTTNGFPLAPGESIEAGLDSTLQGVWGIVVSGTVEVRTFELGVS